MRDGGEERRGEDRRGEERRGEERRGGCGGRVDTYLKGHQEKLRNA